jgi:hypothetical protein
MPAIGKLGLRVPEVNPFDITNPNLNYVEQNRVDLLRILLDGKVKCSHCGYEFRNATMDRLSFTEWTMDHTPEKLMVTLYCGPCGHEGPYNMKPNPFMDSDNIGIYGALVNTYRDENNAWPTESTMKEVPRKPRFPVPGKE